MTKLAPHLSEPERMKALADALTAARTISNVDYRAAALIGLVAHIAGPERTEGLANA